MKVEIGSKIKEVFESRNMKLTDFADQLGTVRQNVYRIFKKRHLDTGLLFKISQVLQHNFFQYYTGLLDVKSEVQAEKPVIDPFEHQLAASRKEIDYLRRIIKLMEEKAELFHQVEEKNVLTD